MYIERKANRRIRANSEVEVAPEATELLFEAQDVADLVAAVTDEDVQVETEGEQVVFTVGEDEFTVEPEGDEEVLESVRTNKRPVKANRVVRTNRSAKRPVRR